MLIETVTNKRQKKGKAYILMNYKTGVELDAEIQPRDPRRPTEERGGTET